MSDCDTPNSKLSVDGGMPDRMYHHSQRSSLCNPTPPASAEVRRVGRQASSAEYGYSTYPSYSRPVVKSNPSDNAMSFAIAKRFALNQRVSVNIEGSGWLVGTVVAILTAVKSLTGSLVRVKYSTPLDSQERTTDVPDDPRFIRPVEVNHQSQAVHGGR